MPFTSYWLDALCTLSSFSSVSHCALGATFAPLSECISRVRVEATVTPDLIITMRYLSYMYLKFVIVVVIVAHALKINQTKLTSWQWVTNTRSSPLLTQPHYIASYIVGSTPERRIELDLTRIHCATFTRSQQRVHVNESPKALEIVTQCGLIIRLRGE